VRVEIRLDGSLTVRFGNRLPERGGVSAAAAVCYPGILTCAAQKAFRRPGKSNPASVALDLSENRRSEASPMQWHSQKPKPPERAALGPVLTGVWRFCFGTSPVAAVFRICSGERDFPETSYSP
jgi:hypothetical protein